MKAVSLWILAFSVSVEAEENEWSSGGRGGVGMGHNSILDVRSYLLFSILMAQRIRPGTVGQALIWQFHFESQNQSVSSICMPQIQP